MNDKISNRVIVRKKILTSIGHSSLACKAGLKSDFAVVVYHVNSVAEKMDKSR